MTLYRFTLDSITCRQPRSQGEYFDTLSIAMYWRKPPSLEPRDMRVSPLGLQGRRISHAFGPGTTHELKPADRAGSPWPGLEAPWEMTVDLPDNGRNVVVGVLVVNQRDISDPYAVTKAVTALGTAVAVGAGGALVGKTLKGFSAVLLGAFKGVFGGVIKTVMADLFEDWPKCAGIVFVDEWSVNVNDLADAEFASPVIRHSGHMDSAPEGCRQPEYTTQMSWKSFPQFPGDAKVVKRTYVPITKPKVGDWVGQWADAMSSPKVSVNIARSQHLVRVDGGTTGYAVTVSEKVRSGRSTVKHIDGELLDEPVFPSQTREVHYHGEVTVGHALRDVTNAREIDGVFWIDPATSKSSKKAAQAATKLVGVEGAASRVLRTVDTKKLAAASNDALKTVNWRRFRKHDIDVVVVDAFTEPGVSLDLTTRPIRLRLYRIVEQLDDGTTRKLGPVIRYRRSFEPTASASEYELSRWSEVQ